MKYPQFCSILPIFLTVLLLLGAESANSFSLESTAFPSQGWIPTRYTCDGNDIAPTLSWKDAPQDTRSYVLIVDDADAPNGTWIHWLVFNIPKNITQIQEQKSLPTEALTGINSWGQRQYGGPCPPKDIHRYVFKLYALNTRLTVNSSTHYADILNAMQGHIIAETHLVGLYGRKE